MIAIYNTLLEKPDNRGAAPCKYSSETQIFLKIKINVIFIYNNIKGGRGNQWIDKKAKNGELDG